MARRAALMIAATAIVLMSQWGGLFWFRNFDRVQTEAAVTQSAENLVIAFEENVSGILANADWALQHLRDIYVKNLEAGDIGTGIAALARERLPPIGFQLTFIDPAGFVAYSNLAAPGGQRVDLSDREHFRVHLDPSQDQLFVSRPVFGRVSKIWSVQLTRKVARSDGTFAGVLVLSVDRRHFIDFFNRIDIGERGVITLVGLDGWVRARAGRTEPLADPYTERLTDRPFLKGDAPPSGPLRLYSQFDREVKLGAYLRVPGHPLVVTVLYSVQETMQSHQARIGALVKLAALLTLVEVIVAFWLIHLLDKRDQARRLIEAVEARWRLALEAVGDAVWEWRPQEGTVTYSPAWFRMLGFDPAELVLTLETWRSRLHPDDRATVLGRIERHLAGESTIYQCEYRLRRKDETYLWVLSRGVVVERTADGAAVRMIGLLSEITARKRLEEELAARNQQMQDLRTALARRELGIARHRLSEAQRLAQLGTLEKAVDAAGASLWQTCPHAASLLGVEPGATLTVDGLLINVPAPDRLALAAALHGFPQSRIDLEFPVTGVVTGEVTDEGTGEGTDEGTGEGTDEGTGEVTDEGTGEGTGEGKIEGEANGETRYIHAIGSSEGGPDGRTPFIMLQDVTARRAAERERELIRINLEETSRLEALGTLAAGIAHEINTPAQFVGDNLSFIRDCSQSLLTLGNAARNLTGNQAGLDRLTAAVAAADLDFVAQEMPAAIDQALAGMERISAIVRAVKEFCYPSAREAHSFDLNQLVRNAGIVTRNSWKYVAELVLDLDEALPPVTAIEGEINQVVVNLVINAGHAIEERGEAQPGRITVSTRCSEDAVILSVADNGTGIRPEVQKKIFDLFFTTKPPGKGSGQGLAVSRAIASRHGGSLEVVSKPGEGARFDLRLPLKPH